MAWYDRQTVRHIWSYSHFSRQNQWPDTTVKQFDTEALRFGMTSLHADWQGTDKRTHWFTHSNSFVKIARITSCKFTSILIHGHCSLSFYRAHELCESRGGRPGLPFPNSLYGLGGRKATLNSLSFVNHHFGPMFDAGAWNYQYSFILHISFSSRLQSNFHFRILFGLL